MINRFIYLFIFVFGFSCSSQLDMFKEYSTLAKHSEEQGDLKSAITYYQKAIMVESVNTARRNKTIFMLAQMYQDLGAYNNAIKYYRSLLKDAKYLNKVSLVLANIYYKMEDFLNAASFYKIYFERLDNKDKVAIQKIYLSFAKSYFFLKEYKKAIEILDTIKMDLISLEEKQSVLLYKAEAIFYLSDLSTTGVLRKNRLWGLKKVRETLDNCISLAPSTKEGVSCLFFISDVYIRLNQKNKALESLEKIYYLYPSKDIIKHKIDMIKKYY